jgi:hypothetical protein
MICTRFIIKSNSSGAFHYGVLFLHDNRQHVEGDLYAIIEKGMTYTVWKMVDWEMVRKRGKRNGEVCSND